MMWREITWSPVPGQAAVTVTFKWYLTEDAATPWHTEATSFLTSDRAVTDEKVIQYVRERDAAVAEMYERYSALADRLNLEAGNRVPVGGTP